MRLLPDRLDEPLKRQDSRRRSSAASGSESSDRGGWCDKLAWGDRKTI
jgi:hypothetical protein